MRKIGLLGGMSWESSRIYYDIMNREVQRRLGGLHSARIVLDSFDMAEIAALQSSERWDEAACLLAAAAVRLEEAGADAIALATNTMHKCAPSIAAALRVPFLHIVDTLSAQLLADGRQHPLLLATRFTMEQDFYRDRLRACGLPLLLPSAEQRARLHSIIYDELCRGMATDQARRFIVSLATEAARRGADSVILGCTELCMVADGLTALPTYDSTAIHARALVDFALAEPEGQTQGS